MNDALRHRAELHLVQRLFSAGMHARSRHLAGLSPEDPDEDRPERRRRFEAATETLHAVDALSSSEAKAWLRRFASAVEDPAQTQKPAPDPDASRRTSELLDRLLADRAAGEGPTGREPLGTFERTLAALEDVGALSRDEWLRWRDRLNAELGLPSLREQEVLNRQRTCVGHELRRVIAGPVAGKGALQITHLELYSDGAMIYWHEAGPAHEPEDRLPRLRPPPIGPGGGAAEPPEEPVVVVCDDLGTAYECQQGRHAKVMAVVPAIPEGATRLELRYGRRRFEVALG